MTEALLIAVVLLLAVVIGLQFRRTPEPTGFADLQRRFDDLRIVQEATKTEVAQAQAAAVSQVATQLQTTMTGFHSKVGELTRQLTAAQGQSAETIRAGLEQARNTLNTQIASLTQTLSQNLTASQKNVGTQLTDTTRVVGDLRKQLGALEEAAKGMQTLGKEVAELQNILRAPKLRGNLGESLLEELLSQVLGPNGYEAPHQFADGMTVDAAIRIRGQWVPVDSKFPIEAFNRMHDAQDEAVREAERKRFLSSVRARVDEITKYIRPAEGTFEFALMYIPAEGIYYEVVVQGTQTGVLDYALDRRVIPVSPNTMYAYLATIAMGLRGMRIEERAQEIQREMAELQQQFGKFFELFQGVGRNLDLANRKYFDASRKADKLGGLIEIISGVKAELPEAPSDADIQSDPPQAAVPARDPPRGDDTG